MNKDGNDVPLSLNSLFYRSDDSDCDSIDKNFNNLYSSRSITLGDKDFIVREYSWDENNANRIWPCTYLLADYIKKNEILYQNRSWIEFGSGTGVLALFISSLNWSISGNTTDFDDGIDDNIAKNIKHNFDTNNISSICHLRHSWGNEFIPTMMNVLNMNSNNQIEIIFASDILIYAKQYQNLVQSLSHLFDKYGTKTFLMAWNRPKFTNVEDFFTLMKDASFIVNKPSKNIYSFTKEIVVV